MHSNPDGDIIAILARYDIDHALDDALRDCEAAAADAVLRAWRLAGTMEASGYREALLADIPRAYSGAKAQISAAVRAAYAAVPPAAFIPGVTQPGANPGMAAAVERAGAVQAAVAGEAAKLALRNRLTVGAAAAAGSTERTVAVAREMAQAGEEVRLKWRCSSQPPDPKTCPWCRSLNGTFVLPGQQFAHPVQLGERKPPRLYRGTLFGPQLHPNCRCWLEIVTGPLTQAVPEQSQAPGMFSSADIKNMPDERYEKLVHFLRASLHELGQMLRRLVLHGRG